MPPVTLLQMSSPPEKPSCLLVSAHAQQAQLGAWVFVAGRPEPGVHSRAVGSRVAAEPVRVPGVPPSRMCCREGRQQRRAALPDIYPSRHLPFQTWSLQRWSLQRWSLQAWNLQTPDLQTWDLQTWNPQAWNLQVQKTDERPGPSAARSARRALLGVRLGARAGNTAKSGAPAPRRWRWQRRWPGGPISCRSGWRALAPPMSTSPVLRPGR